jgi:predicted amidohydrolase
VRAARPAVDRRSAREKDSQFRARAKLLARPGDAYALAMQRSLVFAAVQLSSQGGVAENLERVAARVAEAAQTGADVVVLPENFAYFGDDEGKRAVAEDFSAAHEGGPIGQCLGDLARRHRVHLVAGGVAERSPDPARPFNTCLVYDRAGEVVSRYRKVHLFDVELPDGTTYRESVATAPGDGAVTVDIEGTNVGLSICYDVRFPELYRALSSRGAEVIVVPAAFTLATGKDHWMVLLRARAIEAQAYVVAAAQWGKHPRGRQTFGKSCVIDPWGDVVAQASEGEGVCAARLDPAYLAKVRSNLPALRHRRL